MTEALAELLADRMRSLPFAQRVVGLARPKDTVEVEEFDGKAVSRRIKTPVALTYPLGTLSCDQNDKYLLPDLGTASIFFFKDYGTTNYQIAPGLQGKESTLRLLGWLNPGLFSAPLPEGTLVDALWKALEVNQRYDAGEYQGLRVTATMLPSEASLFSEYTYASEATSLLYPPFQLIGLELKCRCRYLYQPTCPAPALPTIVDPSVCLQLH